jgi:serine/threonine-protein kinase PknG
VSERSPCRFSGCLGTVAGGYCDTCGMAPRPGAASGAGLGGGSGGSVPMWTPMLRPASVRTLPAAGQVLLETESGRTSSRRSSSARLGLGLVDVPPVATGDPADAVMDVAEVPENKRYCSGCRKPVGRSRGGRPGRTEGFCPYCRNRYSFTPKLVPGELLGGQYEVLGAIAHGGLGWVYLARDRAVSNRWVVLKGLLDTESDDAAIAAVAERRFLAALDHPSIVQIYNFVTHDGRGYIVMEYVGGKSLKTLLKERREASGGQIDPLPVDQAIAYVLGVLPPLGYLHAQGYVYCDMKPDNVVLWGDSLKIIDLGGVRPIDDDEAAIYGTVGYQAPEVSEVGPSVASDLYTVGRMLAVLVLEFRGYQTTYVDGLPPPQEQPVLADREALHRFLVKATAVDPADRFRSTEEMAEQLVGILRQEAAARGEAQPAVSAVFGSDRLVASPVDDEVRPDWRLLPRPKIQPDDPAAGMLLGLADGDPAGVAATLTRALTTETVPRSMEALLRLARAHLDAGSIERASATLDRIGDPRDWRLWWHRGVVALARGKPTDAVDWFDPVYTDLSGEVAAKMALALAHELAGDLDRSADLYDRASRCDPSYVSSAFGLARVRVALGDRDGAVAALQRVPAGSSAHMAARISAVRALTARTDGGSGNGSSAPSPDHLQMASDILVRLDLGPRRTAELALEVYEAGLVTVAAGAGGLGWQVLGRPLVVEAVREGLEESYRQLARHATTARQRIDLVDRANQVRPRTVI